MIIDVKIKFWMLIVLWLFWIVVEVIDISNRIFQLILKLRIVLFEKRLKYLSLNFNQAFLNIN